MDLSNILDLILQYVDLSSIIQMIINAIIGLF